MRRVIEPLLGGGLPALRDDDIDYVRNLLPVARRPRPPSANPSTARSFGEHSPRTSNRCSRTTPHGSSEERPPARPEIIVCLPRVLAGELGELSGALRTQRGGPATAAAGVPTKDCQQRGEDRAEVPASQPSRDAGQGPLPKALYMNRAGAEEGHLMIFGRTKGEKRITVCAAGEHAPFSGANPAG